MIKTEDPVSVGNGILDTESWQVIAADSVLNGWLASRTLQELLPDLEVAVSLSAHTRICHSNGVSTFAKVAITPLDGAPLDGKDRRWSLLRIELTASQSDCDQFLDVVTGLPDRRALEPHRLEWLRESSDCQVPHALLFVDLDGFKQINDQFGHAIGDRVLTIVAERLRKALRSHDLIVRYGGDEFVVLLAQIKSLAEVQPISERLSNVMAEPITIEHLTLSVSMTIGIALATSTATPLDELLMVADQNMYAAKPQLSK